ncbi:efflux RND transporter periplasmic adaptor subunit [Bacteroides salyersiae]|uniref:efflux RND transporter periplasmic adaptor subunit n=1 Tax=Bacteroides salyersiae TaxID=291644 RepID=UPI0034A3C60C
MKAVRNKISRAALLGCCLLAVGCGDAPTAQTEAEYEVLTLVPSERTLSSSYSAAIRGCQDIDIYPQVSGTLTRICVAEGEKVKQGQPLFIIDQVPYEAALQTALANVEASKAALASAQLSYDSKRELYNQNVVSEFDLNTANNTLLAAKAQLSQAQAQELNARNNLSYTVVKSPADGVTGMLPFRVGALVSANLSEPLTTVSDNSTMHVYFSMTENQLLEQIRQYGSKEAALEQMPEVNLRLNDRSEYPQKGKIEAVSGVIDRNTGTVGMRAAFPNPDGLLHSGGAGNIVVPTQRTGVLVIPRLATYEIQNKIFVYKVVNGKAQPAQVEVTAMNGGQEYIVESGLTTGEKIVVEGVGLLREGTPIKERSGKTDLSVQ